MEDQYLISIIIPTINRKEQFNALLASIKKSEYQNYEIIVVDQNGSNLLDNIITGCKEDFSIQHYKVNFKGAAKARNYGALFAQGELLCFPDDDAEIFPNTLSIACNSFNQIDCSVLFGKCIDKSGKDSVLKFNTKAAYLTLQNHDNMFVESTMFVKSDIFKKYEFDETFGIGTFYGAEEGYDLILRMLTANISIYYNPILKIYHPQKKGNYSETLAIQRVFSYRCGLAHLCMKHKLYKKLLSRSFKIIAYLSYLILFDRAKVRYYLSELLGILAGVIVR
ncbi:hypothetical protein PN36_17420 [Candidatus Thiomargarita nelsonii]|uniref:Glycosyltransferase 2-like domain-containing protein n=1 Tax=Candidatus Thiomargarita nelsonii TaxID=1003181 RepID=A0A0A6PJC2_9GAMM|nr:hypothetical protein PN36_17420 [Candidatus Thiomargarita nelsonii]